MRELRSCDFCGADAVGTFAVVPPELEPSDAEQRRVVLCPDCKDRLQTLLEPLLARAGVGDATANRTNDAGASTDAASTADDERGTVVASADESTEKQSRTTSPNATVSDADDATGSRSEPATGTDSGADSGSEPQSDDADAADTTDGSLLEDGITFERSDTAETSETDAESTENVTGDTTSDAGEGDADDSSADDTDVDEPQSDDSSPADTATRPPSAYGKVIRLLRNREFPMKRTAVENLAAGAYDLESHEVDEIIDYAIEQDEFVEKRGKLKRP